MPPAPVVATFSLDLKGKSTAQYPKRVSSKQREVASSCVEYGSPGSRRKQAMSNINEMNSSAGCAQSSRLQAGEQSAMGVMHYQLCV